jgi:hypothetical protein
MRYAVSYFDDKSEPDLGFRNKPIGTLPILRKRKYSGPQVGGSNMRNQISAWEINQRRFKGTNVTSRLLEAPRLVNRQKSLFIAIHSYNHPDSFAASDCSSVILKAPCLLSTLPRSNRQDFYLQGLGPLSALLHPSHLSLRTLPTYLSTLVDLLSFLQLSLYISIHSNTAKQRNPNRVLCRHADCSVPAQSGVRNVAENLLYFHFCKHPHA